MGLLDKLKGMFGKKAEQPLNQLGNDVQGVAGGNVGQMSDLLEDAKDVAANVDVPGTDVDDKLKESLGVNENQQK